MTSNEQEQQNINITNNTDAITSTNNQEQNKTSNTNSNQASAADSNLNKSHQLQTQDIRLNKLNTNTSVNIPSANTATNISLNDQILQQKKDQSDYFDNEVSYQDEEENDPIFKEYTMINNRRNKAIDDLKNINERIKNNNIKIEEIKQNLIDLKEEKKKKQEDIVNLLSNKESIEEIYKNQLYSLCSQFSRSNRGNNNLNENNDTNNLINISIKNDMNDNSTININSNHNITIDNEIVNNDEDNFKISLNEIKESDQKKYIEQVISMFEDIFKKRDDKINASIANIIKSSYELFVNNSSAENDNGNNNELIVVNFLGKVSLFISNYSLGRYSESKINLFLRYLLKINALNVKLTKYIKFVNKKYKEKKKELNDMINFLEKKNITLAEKNNRLEDNMKDYEDRLEFFGKNDVFEIEQKLENDDDDILEDNDNNGERVIYNVNQKRKKLNNRNNNVKTTNSNDKNNNEEQLSHEVVIEYEDGIDQNVEINYEEDDLVNEYDYEKENEMIKQGLNPYNSENNQYRLNQKKISVLNKERIRKKNDKQIIVNDNDENDKYLNEFLQKDEKKLSSNTTRIHKKKKIGDMDYLIIEDDDNKDFIDINDENILDNNLDNKNIKKNNYNNNLNDKNNMKNYSNQTQIAKKINYPNNIISDNRICPTPQPKIKTQKDLDKLSTIELEHYNRVQRIMNAGPKVNNIFGVNNYNPENSIHAINIDNNVIFSPKKSVSNFPTSSNKIDKTIRIGSRQNHNFISIINMTKNVPVKKKNGKDKDKTKMKEKRKASREINDNNEGIIQIINLEENFLNEIKDDEKNENENENKTGNESTSMLTNNNNSKRNNSNEKLENDDSQKTNTNNTNNTNKISNNSKNEVQGYYLNIINTKQQSTENEDKEIINSKNNYDEKETDNLNKKNESNEFLTNSNKKTIKITKSRELNINDIKNNKLGIMNKKIISKTAIPKNNNGKVKSKFIYLKNIENKDNLQMNNSALRPKTNSSFNKGINNKKISNNSLAGNFSNNNSYVNIKDTLIKRSHSISENIQNKKEDVKNKYNSKKIILNNDNNNFNVSISPIIQKNRKINIPISKMKNTNINSYQYEGNYKTENKVDNPNINKYRK